MPASSPIGPRPFAASLVAAAMLAGAAAAQPATVVDGTAPKESPLPRLLSPRSIATLPAAEPAETIAYGDHPAQRIELFLPKGADGKGDAGRPVVVLLSGGCFSKNLGGLSGARPAAGALVDKGYAVWSVGYRRVDEEGGGYPGTYQDIATAIDALRDHAEKHALDAARVTFMGHSAGAFLALWATGRHRLPQESPLYTANPLKPRGTLALAAFGSLPLWGPFVDPTCGPGTLEKLLAPGEGPARVADTSPDKLLPTGVPIVLLNGVYDAATPPAAALDHAIAARKAGDRASLEVAPMAGHFEPWAPNTAAFAQAMAALDRLNR